ncbi:MAG: FYDLN acid domain-containing protein [Nitrospinae bacterium]|nr:FYDLN acid domain-containing protein [Nitrospinota bacterium]
MTAAPFRIYSNSLNNKVIMTHPKYGNRFTCFQCGIKFYDLGKEEPLCPKCGADQRKAPKKPTTKPPKPVVIPDYDNDEAEDEIDTDLESDDLFVGGGVGGGGGGGAAGFETDDMMVDDIPDDEE